jgi:HK97 family phage major capsid protein
MSIQALREQRAAKAKELHTLVNVTTKDKPWTAENQATYDTGMAEIEALDAQIKRINDLNA